MKVRGLWLRILGRSALVITGVAALFLSFPVVGRVANPLGVGRDDISPYAPYAEPASIQLTATPPTQQAGQAVSLRAEVLDGDGQPVGPGVPVTFTTTLGTVQPSVATTDADGVATAVITSTQSGLAVVTAGASSVQSSVAVTFLPGPLERIYLEADPPAIPVDGATSQILATLTDRFGNLVTEDITVTFATSLGSIAPITRTAVAGRATAVLTSGPLHGTAEVTATAASHIGTTTVQIQPADLEVTCTASPSGDILPGTVVTYTIEYANRGVAVARDVRITDTLPVGLVEPEVVAWSGAAITRTQGTTFTWQVEDLSTGEGGTIILRGRFDRQRAWPASRFVTNQVRIQSRTADGNPANNLAAAGNLIVTADLYIQKSSSMFNDFAPGRRIRYEIAFGNYQRVPAEDVRITDTLPAYTRFWDDTSAQAGLVRLSAPGDSVQVWESTKPITSANAGRFVVWLDIDPAAPGGTVLDNVVEIGTTTPESDLSNNRTQVSAILAGVNLVVTLRGSEIVRPGQPITYTLRYTNTGHDPAPASVLTHTLPVGVSFESATRPPDTVGDGQATWQLGELAAGQSGFIEVHGTVSETVRAGQSITGVLTITSAAVESYTADNTARWATQVVPDVPSTLTIESPYDSIPVGGFRVPIQVQVMDRFGNPIDGLTVTLSTTAGVITPTVGTTVNGAFLAHLISPTHVGQAVVTARTGALEDSLVIEFQPGPAAQLFLTAAPTEIPADGHSKTTIQATVLDAFGNAVADNTPVVFTTTLGRLYNGSLRHVVGTFDGIAATTLQAGHTPGTAWVQAEVEGLFEAVEVVFQEVPIWRIYLPLVARESASGSVTVKRVP